MPDATAKAIKRAQISGRYQPYPITPATMNTMVNIRRVRMNIFVEFLNAMMETSMNTAVKAHKSHGVANVPWPILITQSDA